MKRWNEDRVRRAVERAKRSALGRAVCAVAGDRTGAVMLEYVLLAIMISVAVVVAIMYFGNVLRHQINAAGEAASGNSSGAKTEALQAKASAKTGEARGKMHSSVIHDQTK